MLASSLERFQQFGIILFDESALNLYVDTVADQSQFVLGEYTLIWENALNEGPAFADKAISISCALYAVKACNMKNSRGVVSFETVKQFKASVLVHKVSILFIS